MNKPSPVLAMAFAEDAMALASRTRRAAMTEQAIQRFWAKVQVTEGCWLWNGTTNRAGYGRCGGGFAHRVAYQFIVGRIPEGMELDHLCRQRNCVNPDHLEPATHHVNMLRGCQAQQTHCINGHPFNDENTRIRVRRDGTTSRQCYPCVRERQRRSRAA